MNMATRSLLCPLLLAALALPCAPVTAWSAPLQVPPAPSSTPGVELPRQAPEVRRAGEDLARILESTPPLEATFALLREAGALYDAELAVPPRYVRECRRGRALCTLLGLYRADQAYARAFGEEMRMPLRETLEQTGLSTEIRQGLAQSWDLERASGRNAALGEHGRLRQLLLALPGMDEVRVALDIIYGTLLEQTHVVCASLLRLPPEKWTVEKISPVVQRLIARLDAFRRTLQGWASQPALVKELGLHSDITLLDRVQADLEVLLLQPSPEHAKAALAKVQEERADLVRLCKLPPNEDPGKYWQLQKREDLFRPKNFF